MNGKQTRKEKRLQEEQRLAQMRAELEEAELQDELAASEQAEKTEQIKPQPPEPQSFLERAKRCSKCKVELKDGVCPTCGFKAYEPISEKTAATIRLILTGITIGVLLLIFILMQLNK